MQKFSDASMKARVALKHWHFVRCSGDPALWPSIRDNARLDEKNNIWRLHASGAVLVDGSTTDRMLALLRYEIDIKECL